MIVNLNHIKKQLPVITSFSIGTSYSYFGANDINSNTWKVIHFITIVLFIQFWLQIVSILTLFSCYWLQYYSKNSSLYKNDISWNGHLWFYYKFSLVFQLCDVVMSAFSSYQLRKVKSYLSCSTYGVGSWMMSNDLYVLTSMVWLILFFGPRIEHHAMVLKGLIFQFSVYKAYIIYKMFKNDKASHIILEQISIPRPLENDTPKSSNTEHQQVQSNESEITTTAEKLDNFIPLIHKSGLKLIPITQ